MELYSTTTLIGVQNRQKPDNFFWLDTFFGEVMTFETEEIAFEKVNPSKKMAPFVSPRVQGRVMKREGSTSKTLRPAYVKPKHVVNPFDARPRRVGEAINGSASLDQRYNAIVAENLAEEQNMIRRRLDWMCASAARDGKVIISGEDYPEVEVDFERDPSLDVTLIGLARWGESAADPLGDLKLARRNVSAAGGGKITTLVMGTGAFDNMYDDPKVQAMLKVNGNRGETSQIASMGDEDAMVEYMGFLQGGNGQGRLDIWTYTGSYDGYDGNPVELLGVDEVVGIGPKFRGVRCFGAIMDKKAQLRALEMFPKMWDEEDPSQTLTMTQSAPLMVPGETNASFRIKTR